MIGRRCSTVLLAATLVQGCSVRPEQTIIGDFFAASRLRDLTALSRFATVVFEPREQGIITSFTIRSVSAEQVAGGSTVKQVTLDAPVRTPEGSTVTKVLVVRMQRRRTASSEPAAPDMYAGWIVTGVTELAPSPASPPT